MTAPEGQDGGDTGPPVLCSVAGAVATLTLNRPQARNVLTSPMMRLLADHLRACAADPGVRVVVLAAMGSTFCAGADLQGAAARQGGSFAGSGAGDLVEVLESILDNPKPVIARVSGHVAGGGNGLVAAADLAVAAEGARFAFSEVRVGVAPAVISVVCLPRMRPADARELLLTGERVSARRAMEAGLVNAVVAPGELDAKVATWAGALQRGGPDAIAATKALIGSAGQLPRDRAFAQMGALSTQLFGSAEAQEGIAAFLARRAPSWAPPG